MSAGPQRRLSTKELLLLNYSAGEDSFVFLSLHFFFFSCVCLERILKSPLNYKAIKPVNPKGNWCWIFIGGDWCWSWSSNTSVTSCKEPTHWKRLWCWERLKAGREGDDRGWDGWMASLTQWTWVWANSRRCWRSLVCCSPWGLKESDNLAIEQLQQSIWPISSELWVNQLTLTDTNT